MFCFCDDVRVSYWLYSILDSSRNFSPFFPRFSHEHGVLMLPLGDFPGFFQVFLGLAGHSKELLIRFLGLVDDRAEPKAGLGRLGFGRCFWGEKPWVL